MVRDNAVRLSDEEYDKLQQKRDDIYPFAGDSAPLGAVVARLADGHEPFDEFASELNELTAAVNDVDLRVKKLADKLDDE